MSQGSFSKECNKALIAIGSNLAADIDETRAVVEAALAVLAGRFSVCRISKLYKTPCFPAGSGPDFVNAACEVETGDAPETVLQVLHDIEAEFGRTRDRRWGQRSLDLDLIAIGDRIAPDVAGQTHWRSLPLHGQLATAPMELILPHPRLQDRAFVLVPLADIAPDWVHPILGQSLREMLAACPASDLSEITAI